MKKIFVLGIGIMLLWGCNSQSVSHHPIAIELNNGERWAVSEEMKPFVQGGADLVNSYIQQKQTDYKGLAKQIEAQNNQLINSCTMTGKSHDELHKWLHPHLELVDELAAASKQEEADIVVQKLANSYNEYHKYFY